MRIHKQKRGFTNATRGLTREAKQIIRREKN